MTEPTPETPEDYDHLCARLGDLERGTGESELYDMQADPYQLSSLQNDPARLAERDRLSAKLSSLKGAAGEDLREAETA